MTLDFCYILNDDRKPVACDMVAWSMWMSIHWADRIVSKTNIGGSTVSTVFCGLDHSFGSSDRPVLFETMIFTDDGGDYSSRSCTWDEAVAEHNKAVEKIKCLACECKLARKLDL